MRFLDPAGTLTRCCAPMPTTAPTGVAKAIGAAGRPRATLRPERQSPTTVTDPLGHATSYAYDVLNRLAQATDPNGGITADTYDVLDHLTAVTDPRGLKTDLHLERARRRDCGREPRQRRDRADLRPRRQCRDLDRCARPDDDLHPRRAEPADFRHLCRRQDRDLALRPGRERHRPPDPDDRPQRPTPLDL